MNSKLRWRKNPPNFSSSSFHHSEFGSSIIQNSNPTIRLYCSLSFGRRFRIYRKEGWGEACISFYEQYAPLVQTIPLCVFISLRKTVFFSMNSKLRWSNPPKIFLFTIPLFGIRFFDYSKFKTFQALVLPPLRRRGLG
jgi:hypothetical protein